MVKMSIKTSNKTDSNVKETVEHLNAVSRENQTPLWRDIAERIAGSRRNYASINIGKISKLCNEGDTVVVPGKILGGGYVEKKLKVSALYISEKALRKMSEAGGEFIPLDAIADREPKGTNLKVMR
ncbi:MAG: 50S ribosomal protein L18e [Candidatus Thermoplasmatota archaeon]|jgi:large subunit ribosomal protein L18e|nr:50S ribosomal protein L18e [Candidatus Thermoplasmatota archaeon]